MLFRGNYMLYCRNEGQVDEVMMGLSCMYDV